MRALLFVLGAFSMACSGDESRLDRGECEEWMDRYMNPPVGPSPWEDLYGARGGSDAAFLAASRSAFTTACLDGDIDREELTSLRRATTDREHTSCVEEGEERRDRRRRQGTLR